MAGVVGDGAFTHAATVQQDVGLTQVFQAADTHHNPSTPPPEAVWKDK